MTVHGCTAGGWAKAAPTCNVGIGSFGKPMNDDLAISTRCGEPMLCHVCMITAIQELTIRVEDVKLEGADR